MKKEIIKTVNYKEYVINIYKDHKAQNPRKWDHNIATFITDGGVLTDCEKTSVYKTMYALAIDFLSYKHIINSFCKIRKATIETDGKEKFCNYWDNNKGWCQIDAEYDDSFSSKILDILTPYELFQILKDSDEVAIFPMAQQQDGKTRVSTRLCTSYYDNYFIGIAFIDKFTINNYYGDEYIYWHYKGNWKQCALERINMELATYNGYCNGEVYGYEVIDNNNCIESLGGYYGDFRLPEAIAEAKHTIDKYIKQPKKLALWHTIE